MDEFGVGQEREEFQEIVRREQCPQASQNPMKKSFTALSDRAAKIVEFCNPARVEFGSWTPLRTAINGRLESRRKARQEEQSLSEFPHVQEVFLNPIPRPLTDSLTLGGVSSKLLEGRICPMMNDSRESLFHWLKPSDNPYFAPNFVN